MAVDWNVMAVRNEQYTQSVGQVSERPVAVAVIDNGLNG